MTNWVLYGIVALNWGSAWIMVKSQLGVVAPEVSSAYRMGIAAVCLFGWAIWRRVTSERVAYVTVFLPIVALGLSSLFEEYQWSAAALLGVSMILSGNVLVLASSTPRLENE